MTSQSKSEARRLVQARLGGIDDKEYQEQSVAALQKARTIITRTSHRREIKSILAYRANPRWREVAIEPLEEDFPGVRFDYVPRVADAPFPTSHYDVILVPVFGFSADSYRLGHGSGWYDRLLSRQDQALSIGIGLEAGRIDFAMEPHDMRLDYVITDQKKLL